MLTSGDQTLGRGQGERSGLPRPFCAVATGCSALIRWVPGTFCVHIPAPTSSALTAPASAVPRPERGLRSHRLLHSVGRESLQLRVMGWLDARLPTLDR